jgi:hypothetical protein
MLTVIMRIATSRRVSDNCGDLWRWRETGISFGSQVEESKKVVRSSRSVVEGCGELSKVKLISISVENAKICAQRQRCLITDTLSQQSDHGDGKQDNENIVLLKPELFTIRALEGLTVEGEEKDIVREIRKRNREGEVEMQVTTAVKELKRGNWRSMRGEEWKAQDGLILF